MVLRVYPYPVSEWDTQQTRIACRCAKKFVDGLSKEENETLAQLMMDIDNRFASDFLEEHGQSTAIRRFLYVKDVIC